MPVKKQITSLKVDQILTTFQNLEWIFSFWAAEIKWRAFRGKTDIQQQNPEAQPGKRYV